MFLALLMVNKVLAKDEKQKLEVLELVVKVKQLVYFQCRRDIQPMLKAMVVLPVDLLHMQKVTILLFMVMELGLDVVLLM